MKKDDLKIIFVDDDSVTCSIMQRNCEQTNYSCQVFQSPVKCLEEFEKNGADLLVTDLRMPEMSGFDLLTRVREIDSDLPVLVMTGYSSVENAVEAMKLGATDFIKKPFDFEELKLIIDRNLISFRLKEENQLLKRRLQPSRNRFGMIGDTPIMKSLFATVDKVASVSCNVIITGDSGTGKELVARALHDYSARKDKSFVVIDCGALTETLLESELFGHEKGAFTGASQRKRGLMEQASGGSLFLDEICNISDSMQMKLMRAIESQTITRVGSTTSVPIDLRIIAASNRDLEAMVKMGEFRHDFYHRLNVVNIHVPSLNERREDIPSLVEYFVKEFAERYKRQVKGFDSVSMQNLCNTEWAGNIRELSNIVERCVILSETPILTWPEKTSAKDDGTVQSGIQFPENDFPSLETVEREYIEHVLELSDGKKTQAANILGIDKTTLWRKLRKFNDE